MCASRGATWPRSSFVPMARSAGAGGLACALELQRNLLEQTFELDWFRIVVIAADSECLLFIARHGVGG